MRKFIFNLSLLLIIIMFSSGCAVNRATSRVNPGTNLNVIKSMYVKKSESDVSNVNLMITDQLKKMGYIVDTGTETPPNVDAIITYQDKWMWDITWYLLELTIDIRDPKTKFPLATGNSYHTSLTRKKPKEMVNEVINNIFKNAGTNEKK